MSGKLDQICSISELFNQKSPVEGLTDIIEVPVKRSCGSHHFLKGLYLLRASCILIVHLVVTSYSAVCLISCSWKVGANTRRSILMLNIYPVTHNIQHIAW